MGVRSICLASAVSMLCLAMLAAPAAAQTTTAALLGTVTDTQKAVLPGAAVLAKNADTGVETTAVTDANGRYRLAALRPGTYEVRAELSNFSPRARSGLQLFVGQEATLDFELPLAGLVEAVTVTAAVPLVETTKADVSSVIDRKQIDALPLRANQDVRASTGSARTVVRPRDTTTRERTRESDKVVLDQQDRHLWLFFAPRLSR